MKAFTLIIPVALGLCLSASAPAAPLHPFLQRDQWQLEVPAAWEWQGEGEATMLVLKKPSQYQPKVRRPFNLAWFGGAEFESFTLTCEARLDVFNKGNNDFCLAFGGLSDTEFHYAHLGETADGGRRASAPACGEQRRSKTHHHHPREKFAMAAQPLASAQTGA